MIVKRIIQTCVSCPSQWEGHLKDGRMFYARYRWGWLSIEVSKEKTKDVFKAINEHAELIYNKCLGNENEGTLEEMELIKKMKDLGFIF